MRNGNVTCPISTEKADENLIRTAAFIVTASIIIGLILKSSILLFLVSGDFALRAFSKGKYSLIRLLAKSISEFLKLKNIPIDAAPKKFAAALGMSFSFIIGISLAFGSAAFAFSVALLLIFCSLLEGLFAICVGCHFYTLITLSLRKLKNIKRKEAV